LFADWGNQVEFVDVLVRQAHPGPSVEAYRSLEQKVADAHRYVANEGIPWNVLIDDLAGMVHQVYGGLADPIYLIDVDGRVSLYVHWTNAPTLHMAIATLLRQDGRGVVLGGTNRFPHIGAAYTDGWKGLARGLPQSLVDMETSVPGSGVGAFVGHQLKPIIGSLTLKSRPLSSGKRLQAAAITGGIAGALFLGRRRSA